MGDKINGLGGMKREWMSFRKISVYGKCQIFALEVRGIRLPQFLQLNSIKEQIVRSKLVLYFPRRTASHSSQLWSFEKYTPLEWGIIQKTCHLSDKSPEWHISRVIFPVKLHIVLVASSFDWHFEWQTIFAITALNIWKFAVVSELYTIIPESVSSLELIR